MAIDEQKKDPNYIFQTERNIKAYMFYVILILGGISVVLAVAIMMIMPLKQIETKLLTFSDGDTRFVTISDTSLNPRSEQTLLKSILAGYVKNRELINRIDDVERYQQIRTQSSRQVWEAFQNIIAEPSSIYTTPNLSRNIKIINVAVLSQEVATIDFLAEISTTSRSEVSYQKYRAAIEFDFKQSEQTQKDALDNPLGFIVTKYAITEIIEKDKK